MLDQTPSDNRQVRNKGRRGAMTPQEIVRSPWKNLLDIVQKIWAPLGKLFAPSDVPSWLRA